jgi:hypothetical protein
MQQQLLHSTTIGGADMTTGPALAWGQFCDLSFGGGRERKSKEKKREGTFSTLLFQYFVPCPGQGRTHDALCTASHQHSHSIQSDPPSISASASYIPFVSARVGMEWMDAIASWPSFQTSLLPSSTFLPPISIWPEPLALVRPALLVRSYVCR